jgi:5-methylthioribose kinase
MAELLFDRPFNSEERSNTCNPQLTSEVERIRRDPEILTQFSKLKRAFLQQDDCLCHGDLATDNVMVTGEQFRVSAPSRSTVFPPQFSKVLYMYILIARKICFGGGGAIIKSEHLKFSV